MSKYSYSDLKDLWQQVGGSPQAADMAAAIAMAESGGESGASNTNTDGSVDRGLWQINSVHGSQSTFDPIANAKAAVQISNNGTTWRPWCTAWSGPCSGTYLASNAPYQKFLNGSSGSSSSGVSNAGLPVNPLNPMTWLTPVFKVLSVWFLYGLMTVGGAWLMWIGFWILVLRSDTAKTAISLAVSKGKVAYSGQQKKQKEREKAQTSNVKPAMKTGKREKGEADGNSE
jgi:hypothetical protein